MIERYSTILFDFDFTLGDSSEGICDCINTALVSMNYPHAKIDEIHRLIGMPLDMMFTELTKSTDYKECETFKVLFRERAKTVIITNSIVYEGVRNTLSLLHQRKKQLGVVSTKLRAHIEGILEKYDCRAYFDLLIGGDNVKNYKPDPEGLLLAHRTLQVEQSCILYVGDTTIDAEASHQAGIDFVAVLSGTTPAMAFHPYNPVAILQNVNDLIQIN